MNIDTVIEETAKDVAAEAKEIAADESAKDIAEEASEESGDRTDGIDAAGAPGATPATEPPAAGEKVAGDQPSTSAVPSPSKYLKVGEDLFVCIPGTASSRAPIEGEIFDEEALAVAGLKVVDEPSTSGSKSQEE